MPDLLPFLQPAVWEQLLRAPNAVARLRGSILGLAVRGQLVPQNADDEPARVLVERIKNEKARLVREKKLKKQDDLPPIRDEEKPFALPQSWEWVRLGEVARKIHYGYTASANYDLDSIRMLRITDIQNNRVNWDRVPGCEINEKEAEQYLLNEGDLLIARTGGTIGKTFLMNDVPLRAVFASYLIRAVPASAMWPRYLKIALETPDYWRQLYAKSMGTGQPNVNGTSLQSLTLPLPPLAEQKHIVAKVEELLAQCDELETQNRLSQETGAALWQAIVANDE